MARAKARKRTKVGKAKTPRRKAKTQSVKAKTPRRKARTKSVRPRTKVRKARSRARASARRARAGARARAKTFTILILAGVPESEVIRDVRTAIKREVSFGGETNFRWVPAEPPMALLPGQWEATGGAIVDDLRGKYPKLAVKRQEIGAHHKKELTVFRGFLTKRITA